MNITASTAKVASGFPHLGTQVSDYFNQQTAGGQPLFRVTPKNGVDLYDLYLDNMPAQMRQEHTCSCCRTFIHRFGALVTIGDDGSITPAVWPEFDGAIPIEYVDSIHAMGRAVATGKVESVFLSEDGVWGTPHSGGFEHFAVMNPSIFKSRVETAGQHMALKRQHFAVLSRSLAEFGPAVVDQAINLLESDNLYRGDKFVGPARFLKDLHAQIGGMKGPQGERRRNIIWKAAASAPAGFCTPRSGMIGTLLEDIEAGLPSEAIQSRFAAKMHPLQYQRPQTDASAGAIAEAERLFEKLGLAPALRRRFARLDEIPTIWTPAAPKVEPEKTGGVFGNLKPRDSKSAPNDVVPTRSVPITWDKFARTVLPKALHMEVNTPPAMRMSLGALVTAVDPSAPPLLKWDHEDARNPVSWYLYHGGSTPERWSIKNHWTPVTAAALNPSMWGDKPLHGDNGAILILEGAKDTREPGVALFPETMRSELHGVRKVIEQYSRSSKMEGAEDASACGILIGKQNDVTVRVTTDVGVALYRIDRWD